MVSLGPSLLFHLFVVIATSFAQVKLSHSGDPTLAFSLVLNIWDFTLCKQKSSLDKHLPEILRTWHLNAFSHRAFVITFLNSPVLWYSHSIMSKKIGMVAFRSSTSGIRVISKMGPTIPGIKQILFWPETKPKIFEYLKSKPSVFRKTSRSCNHLKPSVLVKSYNSITSLHFSSEAGAVDGYCLFLRCQNLVPGMSRSARRVDIFTEDFDFSVFWHLHMNI